MHHISTISLHDGDTSLHDVQIWGVTKPPLDPQYHRVPHSIDPRQVPLYLIQASPLTVYTGAEQTEKYFRDRLSTSRSLVFGNQDRFLIFYWENAVQALVISFSHIDRLVRAADELRETPFSTVLVPHNKLESNVSIFDKVLSDKRKPREAPQTRYTATPDMSHTLNKLILSGLRIRGLSTNGQSVNERLAIKEIHQMTYKSAQFALRKYNGSRGEIKQSTMQEIVEKLLEVYVDI